MEIYACGLNSHSQLTLSTDSQDVATFLKIAKGKQVRVLCVTWSALIIEVDKQLFYQGYYQSGSKDSNISCSKAIKSIFGDIEGIQGALTAEGDLFELVPNDSCSDQLKFQRSQQDWHRDQALQLEHIAIAGNGQVAIVAHARSSPASTISANSLYMFPSMDSFRASTHSDSTTAATILPVINYLDSTVTSFIALANDGNVLSWGSPLHPYLLGRHPTSDAPAESPHPVRFLQGTPIRKIAAGGWICTALSRDNDLYIWGGQPGNKSARIDALPDWQAGEDVKLADIDGGVNILDAAVGDGHVLVLTERKDIWVTGQGHEGQLGLNKINIGFEQGWKKSGEWNNLQVLSVEAGGWNSFVIVKSK